MQRGGGCYEKKKKKGDKFDIIQKPSLLLFLIIKRRYFDQKLPEESNKNSPDALQIRFLVGIGSFCCEKVEKKAYLRAC